MSSNTPYTQQILPNTVLFAGDRLINFWLDEDGWHYDSVVVHQQKANSLLCHKESKRFIPRPKVFKVNGEPHILYKVDGRNYSKFVRSEDYTNFLEARSAEKAKERQLRQ